MRKNKKKSMYPKLSLSGHNEIDKKDIAIKCILKIIKKSVQICPKNLNWIPIERKLKIKRP